jgi:hypothetical protein
LPLRRSRGSGPRRLLGRLGLGFVSGGRVNVGEVGIVYAPVGGH